MLHEISSLLIYTIAVQWHQLAFGANCDVAFSCFNSTISEAEGCQGYLSCSKSSITDVEAVQIHGALAAYDAKDISTLAVNYNFHCHGYLCAAFAASIDSGFIAYLFSDLGCLGVE